MENSKLRVGIQSLLGYLPAIVIKNILDGEIDSKNLPSYYKINSVSLFADISGFTKLSETFAKKGRIGAEFLTFTLNRYLEQLINIIGRNGGDIFKFAGDAILVIWPQSKNIEESCLRAIQCGLDIQHKLNNLQISPNKFLSVKIGIGVGECMILVVGGQFSRCEYLCVGEALAQACIAETKAIKGGETICSEKVMKYVADSFLFEEMKTVVESHNYHNEDKESFYKILKMTANRIQTRADAYLMRAKFCEQKLRELTPILKAFVPAAIIKYLEIEKENFSKEIRMITIMFLNLKVDLSQTRTDDGLKRIQTIVNTVQRCVYRTRGALNKFLMDDKGSVMLICWGIPPFSSPDDHTRCVESALLLRNELEKFDCCAYMGVTTGSCFTGVCGTIGGRREYTLLGEIVNLSARQMQKAIDHANDLSKLKQKSVNYMILIDKKTKDLIQNKIFSSYSCEFNIKGFKNKFTFFEPQFDNLAKYNYNISPFPEIRTHNDNIIFHPQQNNIKNDFKQLHIKSLFMIGRMDQIKSLKLKLDELLTKKSKHILLVRGIIGSGKSLFIRKCLTEFVDIHKNLKPDKAAPNRLFISFQSPINYYDPMNGWRKILKQIYNYLKNYIKINNLMVHNDFPFQMGSDTIQVKCDLIGKLIFMSYSITSIRFLEEIIETSLSSHYESPQELIFKNFFPIKEIKEIDPFFSHRKFENCEKQICNFFYKLIKTYYKIINETEENPIIFVIEDCHLIDDISFLMIKTIKERKMQGVGVICSFQDPISPLIQNYTNINKHEELFESEDVYIMENITEYNGVKDLILNILEEKVNFDSISETLTNIIISKAFKGNPLFIRDIVEVLVNSNKLIDYKEREIVTTQELEDMDKYNDWSEFHIPLRIEKVLGSLIDHLNVKEIIVLKHASVIGNIFDISKLYRLNPLNNISFDEINSIIYNLEKNEILEILYDLHPKRVICKFSIPFMREICYQRMLIEQKSDIHLLSAKLMQNAKFSYIPFEMELWMLHKHLKINEKSIINYIEEEDDDQILEKNYSQNIENLNKNNLKILQVSKICDRLKSIYRMFSRTNQMIKSGILNKRSDRTTITWENRFVIITARKFIYWYNEIDYSDNQMPLGWFYIKNIFFAREIMDNEIIRSKKNVFSVQVSSWYKKDIVQGSRIFYFSLKDKQEVINWIITLNFLKVKEIYNEFTVQFGSMQLPLNHEKRGQKITNINKKFHAPFCKMKISKVHSIYNNIYSRKSLSRDSLIGDSRKIINRQSNFFGIGYSDKNNGEKDVNERVLNLKEKIADIWTSGLFGIIGYIQDIILNPENIDKIDMFDDKIIKIPKFINDDNTNFQNVDSNTRLLNTNLKTPNNSGQQILRRNIHIIKELNEEYEKDKNDSIYVNVSDK